jgi:hypothetical protein
MRLTRFSANTLSRGRVMPTKTIARLIAVLDTQDLAPAIERLEKATGEAMEREPPEQLTVVDGLTDDLNRKQTRMIEFATMQKIKAEPELISPSTSATFRRCNNIIHVEAPCNCLQA